MCVLGFFIIFLFFMLKGVTTQTVHGSNAIVLYSYSLGGGGGGGGDRKTEMPRPYNIAR